VKQLQSSLFNDTVYKISSVYMKLQQVKMEWGVNGEERESSRLRERETDRQTEH
jgi:hypothetical protein